MLVLDPRKLTEIFSTEEIKVLNDFENLINPHLEIMSKRLGMDIFEMSAYGQNRFCQAGLKKSYIRDKILPKFRNHKLGRDNNSYEHKKGYLTRNISSYVYRNYLRKTICEA